MNKELCKRCFAERGQIWVGAHDDSWVIGRNRCHLLREGSGMLPLNRNLPNSKCRYALEQVVFSQDASYQEGMGAGE